MPIKESETQDTGVWKGDRLEMKCSQCYRLCMEEPPPIFAGKPGKTYLRSIKGTPQVPWTLKQDYHTEPSLARTTQS